MSQIMGRMEFSLWVPFGIKAMHRNDLLGFRMLQLGCLVTLSGWKIPRSVALHRTDVVLLLHYTTVVTECDSVSQQSMLQLEDSNEVHMSPL